MTSTTPGQPMHRARKSMDHADCIIRHLADAGTIDRRTGFGTRQRVMARWLCCRKNASGGRRHCRGSARLIDAETSR